MQEEILTGGRSTTGVVKIGDEVRRPHKKESDFANRFLQFLEKQNYPYSQRYLWQDKQGRDRFFYIDGFVPKKIGETNLVQLCGFMKMLRHFMAQNKNLTEATVHYIRLETVAALFSTLWRFLFLVFITLKKDFFIYILLGVQTFLSIILDTFLVSTLPVSLNLGVNGIAISNIIANVCILAVSFFLLSKDGFQIFKKTQLDFSWLKEWFSVGKFSGIESFLRNLAFMMMVVRMVNVVLEQGNYWVANNFIWNWLLLPALSLADVVKKEIAENQENIRTKTFGYICLSSVFALIWIFSIPLWKPFLNFVMNVAEYETVFRIALIETGFYITFIFNTCIFDATFYGLGKTNYMLIQSVCIDVVYYGIMFILYCTGIFVPTLTGICLMFGIGMTLDFIPAAILYVHLLKKSKITIEF